MVMGLTNAFADAKKLWTKIRLETYNIIEAAADEVMQFVEELSMVYAIYCTIVQYTVHAHLMYVICLMFVESSK